MAPTKRKDSSGEGHVSRNSSKRYRVTKNDRATEDTKRSRQNATEDPSQEFAPKFSLSLIRDEEPLFPRGGGGVLTALERKQIQNQATRDVLFEQKGFGKAGSDVEEYNQDGDVDMRDMGEMVSVNKLSRKLKMKKGSEGEANQNTGVRIECLSFKVRDS